MNNHNDWDMDSDEEDKETKDGPEPLEYVDNVHQGGILSRLNTLRKGGQFCDVELEVNGHNIVAHRAILASSSVYLFELFTSGEESNSFKLDGVDFESFKILVNYAYTAKLEAPSDKVRQVYKTAVLLKMNRAATACSDYLAKHLSITNCLGIRAFANSHSDAKLTNITDIYIQEHISDVKNSPEITALPFIQVDVLGVEEGKVDRSSVKHLCQLVLDWAKASLKDMTLTELQENLQKVYLTADKNLRGCHEIQDGSPNDSDVIRDYKKLARKRQYEEYDATETCNVFHQLRFDIGLEKLTGGRGKDPKVQELKNPKVKYIGRRSQEKPVPMPEEEWKVIAIENASDTHCMCITMLNDTICRLSLSFKPLPPSSLNGDTQSEGDPTPQPSPRASMNMEKSCSLVPLARMSSPRCGVGTAVLDNKLIALGGYDRGECLSSVEAYDLELNEWTPLSPMLSARGRFDVSQLQGKLFACGGSDGFRELKSAELYDPEQGKWTRLADMHSVRSSAGVAVLNGEVYVIGGWSGLSGVPDCEVYDPNTSKWSFIARLNTGRSQAAVCQLGGRLYAIGGCDAWNCINTVETYDPAENKWTMLPPMTVCRRGAGVAVFKGKLYVVGGSDGQASLATVEIYDPATQQWSFGPSLSIPRANVAVAVVRNRLFAVGGFSGKMFLDTVEYLMEDAQEWCGFVPVEGRTEPSQHDLVQVPDTRGVPCH